MLFTAIMITALLALYFTRQCEASIIKSRQLAEQLRQIESRNLDSMRQYWQTHRWAERQAALAKRGILRVRSRAWEKV